MCIRDRYIGWAGRSYQQFAKKTDKPNENEIIINVPVAIGMMSASFLWPVAAWKELVSEIEKLQLLAYDQNRFKCQSSLLGMQSAIIDAYFLKNFSNEIISNLFSHK